MRWTEESKRLHSEKLKGRRRNEQQKLNISEGRLRKKKNNIERFLKSVETTKILGVHYKPSDLEIASLEAWFELYSIEQSYWWFSQLAKWIIAGSLDFVKNRDILKEGRLSERAFIVKYGVVDGSRRYQQWMKTRASVWSKDYWIKMGLDAVKATEKVSDYQMLNAALSKLKIINSGGYRKSSCRCSDFYKARGLTSIEAMRSVALVQRRDLVYFVEKYGVDQGSLRFEESKNRRRETWAGKNRVVHARNTLAKSYNPRGQEARAIDMFIKQNKLESLKSVHGSATDQFSVEIPGIGLRRYDLAIFDGNNLVIIFEYHGSAHINFSHFDEMIRDEIVWDDSGKSLPYSITFGQVYDNDIAKKKFIEEQFPDTLYIVGWYSDLKAKDLRIETLIRRLQDRISEPVLLA